MGLVIKSKVVTVTTAGTPVPVLSSTDAQSNVVSCTIQAITNNIWVGDSTVKAATPIGHKLASASSASLRLEADSKNILDLAKVFLDTDSSGSKANVTYLVRV